ncbi:PEP-CTERM sorting domain-containing protein [Desulfobacter postgatei]|uniref:PEP-CTERM putative exosortase interaction domain-containing protein n=1 Tax=Desulfobacter postgatei 2ac9 TaxID=879212 RepID=I5B6F2_9BACT|nr:PEP-CTERM sorting domain-containing protein [Desulfobacter postgatei]EIM65065.1 PEP-CTERM putative exosortase interaction domain-containing protein [Desulfobacter postgatei 2ac9]
MKKLILFLCVCFFVVGVTPAFTMTINVWEVTNKNISTINSWMNAQYGSVHVLEDFEDIHAGWYTQKETGVGIFTAEGNIGTGATSYNKNHKKSSIAPYFSIQNRNATWYGRSNTKTGDNEVLSTLSWSTTSQSDGFGLDDFSTIHNPEPSTMLLFGFGLIGIASITRRWAMSGS